MNEEYIKKLETLYNTFRSTDSLKIKEKALEQLENLVDETIGKDSKFEKKLAYLLCGETLNIFNTLGEPLIRIRGHNLILKLYEYYTVKCKTNKTDSNVDYNFILSQISVFYSFLYNQILPTMGFTLPEKIVNVDTNASKRFDKIKYKYTGCHI